MTKVTALGLMSGTSMDGIDLAVIRTDGEGVVERGPSMAVSHDASFRKRLEEALQVAKQIKVRNERPGPLAEIEQELTTLHADAVKRFLDQHGDGWRPDIVGFHGQTVLHRPHEALTVQIGDGEALARSIGIRVAYDMRAEDMRHGGQGAPLVPVYHVALAASLPDGEKRLPLCFVNIGGISNITFIPEQGDPIAFDSGPGNALIDQWVFQKAGVPFDEDGKIASGGQVVRSVVDAYLANPFFEKPGPKSLDRHDFDLQPVKDLGLEDGARTLAAVTAEAIIRAQEHLPETPKLWIVCGGGQKNRFIIKHLSELAESNHALVKPADELGLDGDSMEAEAWAYLAVRASKGLPLTFPTTTGCREPVSGGVIAEPA
ncbi:anhydro-N-acetylmuramic acid kinase [Nitratireductor aestuarii]|uniref:Anhydro-N-acetylmuramic acid kinase n=1 Tax=Nitratireductor aestuarii TaxID=1735103 RepID=A0A916RGZ4_9HYPH|nr:anhydro-N-acetylmuramic acid kinase [Nitratireductor aestuarii]GGA55714.1 anhydro-N-acetylmuramic acid kinase [Nitratireductor aestuarii]